MCRLNSALSLMAVSSSSNLSAMGATGVAVGPDTEGPKSFTKEMTSQLGLKEPIGVKLRLF